MIAKVRKLADRDGFLMLAFIPAAALAVYFLFWPAIFFQADASWVGEAFWIVLLVLTAMATFAAVFWALEEWEDRTQKQGIVRDISSVDSEDDKHAFEDKVRDCLNDRSIVGYFKRNLVKEDDVTEALVDGHAFRQACKIHSYESFTSARSNLQNVIRKHSSISCDAGL